MPRPDTSSADAHDAVPAWRRWARMLGRVVQALFVRQLRLRRVDGRLAVALEDTPDGQPATARTPAATSAHSPSPMRAELTALLDAAPGSRKLLRYLAAVEHGLKHKDSAGVFLFEVQLVRLRTALRQLDGLAPQAPSAGLLALRGRIVDAITTHERQERKLEMLMPRSDLMHGNKVEVAEVRASDFDRASEQWRGKGPAA